MSEENLDLTKFPDNSLLGHNIASAKITKMTKEDFLSNYDTLLPIEVIYEITVAINKPDLGDTYIFCPSRKSRMIDPLYDKAWYYYATSVPVQKRFIWGQHMVKWMNYGIVPYATYSRDYNQIEPDFIIFPNSIVPQELTHGYNV